MNISLACDHGGLALKQAVKQHLEKLGHQVEDFGITANKIHGIRCALLSDLMSARLTRQHNDANMMALGAGVVGEKLALEMVDLFLTTPFEGGRHARRVDKVMALE